MMYCLLLFNKVLVFLSKKKKKHWQNIGKHKLEYYIMWYKYHDFLLILQKVVYSIDLEKFKGELQALVDVGFM